MNSINRHSSKEKRRIQQCQRFDKTNQTFIDKLKGYQQFSDVSKLRQKQEEIKRNAERIKEKLSYQIKSPRNINDINQSLGKTIKGSNKYTPNNNNINSPTYNNNNNKQQLKLTTIHSQSLPINNTYTSNYTSNKQTSFSLVNTKFITQQKYLLQQIQKVVNELSIIDERYSSHRAQHSQASRLNYMQLDNFEKYLMTCQKEYQKEYNLVVDRTKQELSLLIQQRVASGRNKHKLHLQSTFNTLKLIDQQSQLLKNGMTNQSQLCQSEWCMQLDKMNEHVLELNNLITEVRLEQTDRFTDLQWKVKEIQFSSEDSIDQQRKNRLSQQHKIYAVIEQLIQKVAMPL